VEIARRSYQALVENRSGSRANLGYFRKVGIPLRFGKVYHIRPFEHFEAFFIGEFFHDLSR
jgi:hypothetical protein